MMMQKHYKSIYTIYNHFKGLMSQFDIYNIKKII